jgi:hypothetical protein
MRRRDGLEKQIRDLEAELATTLSPRQLLQELERRTAPTEVALAGEEAAE